MSIKAIEGQNQLQARAMFDNIADAEDELSFSRGDVLTVVCMEYEGIEGWWLCATSTNHRGLVPSNRLRLITDNDPINARPKDTGGSRPRGLSRDYDVPIDVSGKSLMTSSTAGGRSKSAERPRIGSATDYDVPAATATRIADTNSCKPRSSRREIPRPPARRTENDVVIATTRTSEPSDDRDDYDVPRQRTTTPGKQSHQSPVAAAATEIPAAKVVSGEQLEKTQNELLAAVSQIKSNAVRWRACKRSATTVTSIIQTICTSFRHKLLTIIASYDRFLATGGQSRPLTADIEVALSNLVELIRLSADELEAITGRSRSHQHQTANTSTTTPERTAVVEHDIVGQLTHVADDISVNVGKLLVLVKQNKLIVEQVNDKQNDKDETMKLMKVASLPVTRRQASTDGEEPRGARQKARSNPVSMKVTTDDYDVPKVKLPLPSPPLSTAASSTAAAVSNTGSWPRLLRRHDASRHVSDDRTLDKRVVVVIDDKSCDSPLQSQSFELLERRQETSLRVMPSKIIASRSLTDLRSPVADISNEVVDYDIPVPQSVLNERQKSRDLDQVDAATSPFADNQSDVDVLLRSLREVVENVVGGRGEGGLTDYIRSVMVAVYQIVYVGDSVCRGVEMTSGEVARQSNELSQCARQLAVTWKHMSPTDRQSRRHLADCSRRCVIAASTLAQTINISRGLCT